MHSNVSFHFRNNAQLRIVCCVCCVDIVCHIIKSQLDCVVSLLCYYSCAMSEPSDSQHDSQRSIASLRSSTSTSTTQSLCIGERPSIGMKLAVGGAVVPVIKLHDKEFTKLDVHAAWVLAGLGVKRRFRTFDFPSHGVISRLRQAIAGARGKPQRKLRKVGVDGAAQGEFVVATLEPCSPIVLNDLTGKIMMEATHTNIEWFIGELRRDVDESRACDGVDDDDDDDAASAASRHYQTKIASLPDHLLEGLRNDLPHGVYWAKSSRAFIVKRCQTDTDISLPKSFRIRSARISCVTSAQREIDLQRMRALEFNETGLPPAAPIDLPDADVDDTISLTLH